MAYLHVTNCAKRSVLVCLDTMLVFLLRYVNEAKKFTSRNILNNDIFVFFFVATVCRELETAAKVFSTFCCFVFSRKSFRLVSG